MENILDDEIGQAQLKEKDIFTHIWTSPRRVFKFINDNRYDKYVNILIVLYGISSTFERAISKNMGDSMSLVGIFAFCIILGALFGWIGFFIYAELVAWTGKWLNGVAKSGAIMRILAYAMIPSIASMIFLIPQILLFGIEVFKSDGDIESAGLVQNIFFYSLLVVQFALAVWSIVLSVIAISEVQKLSIGKSILNLLLPILTIGIPLAAIIFSFVCFS